jgi:23S rRNA pseudouridine2605 synthase
MSGDGERLQKALAGAGIGSRRSVERLIEQGRVRVNGERARLGQRIDPHNDKVEVDGSSLPLRPDRVYLLLNKPRGVVTTASDPHGRPTVVDLVPTAERLWPVGRLDIDTEGALVLCNDGDLTFRLTHPSFLVDKTYVAEVGGAIGDAAVARLRRGIELDDGPTAPARVVVKDRTRSSSLVEITIHEGRQRQIRRMLAAVGHPVRRLVRTRIGPLQLGRLRPGTVRRLRPDEVRALYAAARGPMSPSRQDDFPTSRSAS